MLTVPALTHLDLSKVGQRDLIKWYITQLLVTSRIFWFDPYSLDWDWRFAQELLMWGDRSCSFVVYWIRGWTRANGEWEKWEECGEKFKSKMKTRSKRTCQGQTESYKLWQKPRGTWRCFLNLSTLQHSPIIVWRWSDLWIYILTQFSVIILIR